MRTECFILHFSFQVLGLPRWPSRKESACQFRSHRKCRFDRSLGGKDPLEEEWQPTPAFLAGISHGQRSLAVWSMGSWRVGHNWARAHIRTHIFIEVVNFLHRDHVLICFKWPDIMIFPTVQWRQIFNIRRENIIQYVRIFLIFYLLLTN